MSFPSFLVFYVSPQAPLPPTMLTCIPIPLLTLLSPASGHPSSVTWSLSSSRWFMKLWPLHLIHQSKVVAIKMIKKKSAQRKNCPEGKIEKEYKVILKIKANTEIK